MRNATRAEESGISEFVQHAGPLEPGRRYGARSAVLHMRGFDTNQDFTVHLELPIAAMAGLGH